MANKAENLAEITRLTGVELSDRDYKAPEVETLLTLAQDPAKRAEFDAQVVALKGNPAATTDTSAEGDAQPAAGDSGKTEEPTVAKDEAPTISVKVNGDKARGAFIHPTSKTRIAGEKAVSVPDDAWTQDMLAKRFLTEVRK